MSDVRRLGRYELREEIGAGASARVYRAVDTELKRNVALKVLHSHLRNEGSFAKRFRREAEAVAVLQHPNILPIYDVSPESDEDLYFVTEWVESGTLQDWLKEEDGPLPHELAISVGLQVGRGLSAAHREGIIHRDLKPENLMFTAEGHVKIADFGVAHREMAGDVLTLSGNLVGSPSYMAPEQIEGGTIDARTDLFALGVVLYRMITGKLPFGDGPVLQILQRIATGSFEDLRGVAPSIDPRLAALIDSCLATDPGDRPANTEQFREKLQDIARLRHLEDPAEELKTYRYADDLGRKQWTYKVVNSLVEEARTLLKKGTEPTLAIALVDRALELQPFHFEAYRLLEMTTTQQRSRVRIVLIALVVLIGLIFGIWQISDWVADEPDGPQPETLLETGLEPGPIPEAPAPVETGQSESPQRPAPAATAAVTPPAPQPTVPAAQLAAGTLRLATRPWAEVFVNDELKGRTPMLQELQLQPGRHTVRLRNPQTEMVEFTVEIKSGEALDKRVALPILPALLQISVASDEQVWIDGREVYPSDLTDPIELAHGDRTIRFLRGGREQSKTVHVMAGRLQEISSPFLSDPATGSPVTHSTP